MPAPPPPPKSFEQQFVEYISKLRSVDKLDALQDALKRRREELLTEQQRAAERRAAAAGGDHVALAELDRKQWPVYKPEDSSLWWSSTKSLKRMPAGVSPGEPSLQKPQRDEILGGWVGGPKWMFSRERKRMGAAKYDRNPNEPLMEVKMKWFPM